MMESKIIICPICGKRTLLHIQRGDYLDCYPIRIYCLNCHALIKGLYVMNPIAGKPGLTIYNAETEDDLIRSEKDLTNAEYLAEISGELPCKKITTLNRDNRFESIFVRASSYTRRMYPRKCELKAFNTRMNEWTKWRSIAFQLLEEDQTEYLPVALRNRYGQYHYECDNYLKSFHCLQEVVFEYTDNLFINDSPEKKAKLLIPLLFEKIPDEQTHVFVEKIGGIATLKTVFKKVMKIISDFMDIYPNVLPAETSMSFNKNDPDLGISTCTFSDIKTFYLEAYETLLSLSYIPICLNNILDKNNFMEFDNVFTDFFKENWGGKRGFGTMSDDFIRFTKLDNGKKAELIQQTTMPMVRFFINYSMNKNLRNAISHNNYKYDGISQAITIYSADKKKNKHPESISLMDVAKGCIELCKSTVFMAEMILFLLRREDKENHSITHPEFYDKVERNAKCPCCSGKKYKMCCMRDIERIKNTGNRHKS